VLEVNFFLRAKLEYNNITYLRIKPFNVMNKTYTTHEKGKNYFLKKLIFKNNLLYLTNLLKVYLPNNSTLNDC